MEHYSEDEGEWLLTYIGDEKTALALEKLNPEGIGYKDWRGEQLLVQVRQPDLRQVSDLLGTDYTRLHQTVSRRQGEWNRDRTGWACFKGEGPRTCSGRVALEVRSGRIAMHLFPATRAHGLEALAAFAAAGGRAYLDEAIDQAWRAVGELSG